MNSQDHRYIYTIFTSSDKTEDIIYGAAPFLNSIYAIESDTSRGDLVMDIYQPHGDNLTLRPAIIFAHSGGFLQGNRNHDDMVAFCDTFARKGYVTATIDYRQGYYLLSNAGMHSTRSAYRGLQDGRTAVRYLKANAQTYGINPDKVYFAGSSAGAFIGMNIIYMDDPAEKPVDAGAVSYVNTIPPFNHSGPDLGPYDIGNNLNEDGKPDAVIALWGAINNTDNITIENNEAVFLIHGTDDGTVPFNVGNPWGYTQLPLVYGSYSINNRLESIGLTNKETYFVTGADHEFYGTSNGTWSNGTGGNEYWDTIVNKATVFLWKQHKPTADFSVSSNGLTAEFTDLSSLADSWLWNFGDGNSSNEQNPAHTYDTEGTYLVEVYIENDIRSWDTAKQLIYVSPTGIESLHTNVIKIFPNPANNLLNIDLNNSKHRTTIRIYNNLGILVLEKSTNKQAVIQLNVSLLKTGIYFIRIESGTKLSNKKLIIKD